MDDNLEGMVSGLRDKYQAAMDSFAPHKALEEVFRVVQRANKYIDAKTCLGRGSSRLMRKAGQMMEWNRTISLPTMLTPGQ